MKLLIDATISAQASEKVAAAGHDVVWLGSTAKGFTQGDRQLLDLAARDARVVVTLDRQLGEHEVLLGEEHRLLRLSHFKVTEQAEAILRALAEHGEALVNGAVVVIEPGQARVRPLNSVE
jgi:predicted nuclease of predicted toxin-antitoxin system